MKKLITGALVTLMVLTGSMQSLATSGEFENFEYVSDFVYDAIPLGAEIVSINGEGIEEIVSRLKISAANETDNDAGLSQHLVEFLFPQLYTIYYGEAEEKRVGILRIYTFSPADAEYFISCVDHFFREMKTRGYENLVFDVRGNLGGDSEIMDHILSYVIDEPMKSVDRIELYKLPTLSGLNMVSSEQDYSYLTGMVESVMNDERPFDEQRADGAYRKADGTLVGLTPGGNYYDTTAGIMLDWTLPNTKTSITIPLAQLITESEKIEGISENSGVEPDIKVEQTLEDFLNREDTQLNSILESL